jgi:hypothetical protein
MDEGSKKRNIGKMEEWRKEVSGFMLQVNT